MFSHCWHLLKAKFCNALFAFHKALKKDCEPWRTLCWKGLLNYKSTRTPNVENLPGTKLFSEHNEMNSIKGSWHLICKTVIHSGECMRQFWQIDIFCWHASFPERYLFGQLTRLICTLFPWYMCDIVYCWWEYTILGQECLLFLLFCGALRIHSVSLCVLPTE